MQLKFKQRPNVAQIIFRGIIKLTFLLVFLSVLFFLLEKINFPSPKQNYKIDISNEIIKLK